MIFDIEPVNNIEKKFDYEKYLVEELGWDKLPNGNFLVTYLTERHNGPSVSDNDVQVGFYTLLEEERTTEHLFKYIIERAQLMPMGHENLYELKVVKK